MLLILFIVPKVWAKTKPKLREPSGRFGKSKLWDLFDNTKIRAAAANFQENGSIF